MRYKSFLIPIFACLLASFGQAQLTRNKVRLLNKVPLTSFPGTPTSGSGCAGFVSASGKEYAIMGLRNGNAVVNITNPLSPVLIGHIPGPLSLWHEVCVMGNYAYATTEQGGGVQIIDLSQVDNGVVTLVNTITVGSLSRGHTVQAMQTSKVIIVNGGDINGLRAYDVQNPLAPVSVGAWTTKYVHDCFIKKFTSGPYAGKEILFAFAGNGSDGGIYIIDITTTVNGSGQQVPAMTTMGFIRYFPNATNFYCHSGVLSSDNKYLYVNDEFDESNALVTDATTHIINVENLAAPTYVTKFTNPINAIDHNSMIQDGYLMLAAYRQGLRVYDLTNPVALTESGYFDTHAGTGFAYEGAWGVWAGFPSGNVIISDMQAGLWIVDPSEAKGLGAPIISIAFAGMQAVADADKKLRLQDEVVVPVNLASGGASITVNLTTDSLQKNKVDFAVRAKSRSNGQEMLKVYATNQNSGNERLIGGWELGPTMTTYSVSNLNGNTFIKSDNSIRVRVEITSGAKVGAAVDVDVVKATAHN